jgi:tubulin polyglutamylase TTLL4
MHLTNFEVNEDDENFIAPSEEKVENSKWSLQFWFQYLESIGVDVDRIKQEFERITIATIIAGMCEVRKAHGQAVPHRHTSCELYGIDLLIDENLNVYLIELNISPSMNGSSSSLDWKLKFPLNLDVLRLARIIECDSQKEEPCPAAELIDEEFYRSLRTERIADVVSGRVDPLEKPVFADFMIVRDLVEEWTIETGFRFVYPKPENIDLFRPCFDRVSYQDTVLWRWLRMSDGENVAALKGNWGKYAKSMQRIAKSSAPRG